MEEYLGNNWWENIIHHTLFNCVRYISLALSNVLCFVYLVILIILTLSNIGHLIFTGVAEEDSINYIWKFPNNSIMKSDKTKQNLTLFFWYKLHSAHLYFFLLYSDHFFQLAALISLGKFHSFVQIYCWSIIETKKTFQAILQKEYFLRKLRHQRRPETLVQAAGTRPLYWNCSSNWNPFTVWQLFSWWKMMDQSLFPAIISPSLLSSPSSVELEGRLTRNYLISNQDFNFNCRVIRIRREQ